MTKFLLIVGLLIPTVATTRNTIDVCRTISPTTLLNDLPEASGLAVGLGPTAALFAVSDSGPPVVAVLDQSGAVVRKVTLNGARLEDWEAITAARCGNSSCLYVADIGDNRHARSSVTVYLVDEAAATRSTSVDAEAFELAYPDGPHDAESLFATESSPLGAAPHAQRRHDAGIARHEGARHYRCRSLTRRQMGWRSKQRHAAFVSLI